MDDANKHITLSIRKACEGCGISGVKTSKGLCPSCSASQRKLMRNFHKRARKGITGAVPYFAVEHSEVITTCSECRVQFKYRPASGKTMQPPRKYCSRYCQKRASDRVSSKRRRAMTRTSRVERVDPNVVFERDGWKCQGCGAKTPRDLRGTFVKIAPELDHIMPLSLGGEHTYRNTQCLCRQCNANKSNKPMGQLSLL